MKKKNFFQFFSLLRHLFKQKTYLTLKCSRNIQSFVMTFEQSCFYDASSTHANDFLPSDFHLFFFRLACLVVFVIYHK